MPKKRMTLIVMAALALLVSATFANAQSAVPHRFQPTHDTGLVSKVNPVDGTTWSAWTYRQGAETDIAVASRNTDGTWNEPTLFGADDRIEQSQPALTIDHNGNVYVAWAEPNTGRVLVTAWGSATHYWTSPKVVNRARVHGSSPALMIAAQRRLVVGFVGNGTARLVEYRLLPKGVQTQMEDGPDPVGQSAEDDTEGLLDGNANGRDSFGDHDGPGEIEYVGEIRKVTGKR